MQRLKELGFLATLPLLISCGSGSGVGDSGSGGDFAPSNCKPYSSTSAPVSSWTVTKNGSVYDIQVNVDRNKLSGFKSSNTGCSVTSYEVSVVGGYKYIVFDTDPRPTVVDGWDTINFSNSYAYNGLGLSSYTDVSVCFRAFSNLGEESNWYCSSKTVPTGGGSPPPPPPPTDTTPPSTPSNLSVSVIGTTIYLSFTGSTDAQSGISKYWTAILNSAMNQVSPDKQLSQFSTTDSFNASALPAGQTYYYAIIAENGVGLNSNIATKSFYIPINVAVTFRWEYEQVYNCNSNSIINNCSQAKTMKDTELLALKQDKYPSCALTSLGGNTYDLDCRTAQTWGSVVQQPSCGGTYPVRIDYNPLWVPHGISYITGGCATWLP